MSQNEASHQNVQTPQTPLVSGRNEDPTSPPIVVQRTRRGLNGQNTSPHNSIMVSRSLNF